MLYLHVSGSSNPVGTTGNTDRTPFHPFFSFKLRRPAYYYMSESRASGSSFASGKARSEFYIFIELSYSSKTPDLGKEGNPKLNTACLEKVIPEVKMLIFGLSVIVIMVKAKLLKINYPVQASKLDLLSRIEKMNYSSQPGFEGLTKRTIVLH